MDGRLMRLCFYLTRENNHSAARYVLFSPARPTDDARVWMSNAFLFSFEHIPDYIVCKFYSSVCSSRPPIKQKVIMGLPNCRDGFFF